MDSTSKTERTFAQGGGGLEADSRDATLQANTKWGGGGRKGRRRRDGGKIQRGSTGRRHPPPWKIRGERRRGKRRGRERRGSERGREDEGEGEEEGDQGRSGISHRHSFLVLIRITGYLLGLQYYLDD
ncbi:hypothetical protein P170DRAFT_273615 [Aspergillus steynii IBT 23096]|uniref:Uncharacterized protein n=1 Tax=Aspergillus steynii IBT 23096 TaxID=1392250 RepID=A0A2I2FX21_9EURO|nr:uncharacterized protein P170DRAFT_273615 [Aspergillus steynii IBT 23096]PLB45152.1 hypothetical protein P170DRAFT_273615 [Aspergillus steynii IBT 23096]